MPKSKLFTVLATHLPLPNGWPRAMYGETGELLNQFGLSDVLGVNIGAKRSWQFVVGDSDNDKDVDFTDFAMMGNKWMQADSNLYCGGTDLTGDGLVNLEDLAALAENWLRTQ